MSSAFIVTSAVPTPGVENQPAIAADIASLGSNGGTIWFPPGVYQCTNLNVPANITLKGSHSTSGNPVSRLQALANSFHPVLSMVGASGVHIQNITIEDLGIYGDGSSSASAIYVAYVSYLRIYRCAIGNALQAGVNLIECWDSRIIDCDFEFCGSPSGTYGCINCVNGPFDNTNSLVIAYCRFESFFGSCIKGVNNTNKLFISHCKMESAFSRLPFIDLNNCVHISLDNLQMTIDGTGTTPGLVSIVNCYGVFGHISWENTGGINFTNYMTLTNSRMIDLDILVMLGSAEPTAGFIVNWDGLNSANTKLSCQTVLTSPLTSTSSPTPWTPLNLGTALSAWWDPSKTSNITLNAGNIASWTDSSTNAVVASQTTTTAQPGYSATGLNGFPAYIGNSGKFLSAPLSSDTVPFTAFAVTNFTGTGSGAILGSSSNTGGLEFRAEPSGVYRILNQANNNLGASTNASVFGTNALALLNYDGTTWNFSINGTPNAGTSGIGFTGTATTQIGSGVTEPFVGALGDIIKMNTVATLNQIQKIEGWAAWKYGIASVLPSGHPFKTRAPLVSDP